MKLTTAFIITAGLALVAPAAADIIYCGSDHNEQNYCRADTSGGVVLVHQESHSGCWKDDTWGYDRGGIWVANGCRARFRVGYAGSERAHSIHYNSGSNSDVNWGNHEDSQRWEDEQRDEHVKEGSGKGKAVGAALAVGLLAVAAAHDNDHDDNYDDHHYGSGHQGRSVYKCESKGYKYHYCSVHGGFRYATMKRQLSSGSDGQCRFNRDWGYNRSGIWVNHGCRAEFWVY